MAGSLSIINYNKLIFSLVNTLERVTVSYSIFTLSCEYYSHVPPFLPLSIGFSLFQQNDDQERISSLIIGRKSNDDDNSLHLDVQTMCKTHGTQNYISIDSMSYPNNLMH